MKSDKKIDPATMKKIIDLTIVVLTAIASFIGGNACAQTGFFDMFPH